MTRIGKLGTTLTENGNRIDLLWLLVTANVIPTSQIIVTLMMEGARSSEILVLTRATGRKIPEDGILQNLNR
jgi:hypothetical protein